MARRGPVRPARLDTAHSRPIPAPDRGSTGRLVFLPPDWLPLALIGGDAVIVVASIVTAYWYYHNLDPLHRAEGSALPFAPYLLAMPVAVFLYLFALALSQQYRSWRGRSLIDLLLGLYSGIGLAAVLILAAIAVGNLGVDYSRLTITYTVLLTVVLMTVERYLLRQV